MHPLVRVCVGGDNLLLIYGDRHARLWDVRTGEFWRAMTVDKADELVDQGGWAEWYVTILSCLNVFLMVQLGTWKEYRMNPLSFPVLIHPCIPSIQVRGGTNISSQR